MAKVKWFDADLGVPEVSIGLYGLGFNKAVIEMLGKPPRIKLGVLEDKKTMIVAPAEKREKGTLEFASRERYNNVRVNNKSIVRFISVSTDNDFSRTSKYVGIWDEENQWLEFDLGKPVWIASSSEKEADGEEEREG